MRGTFDEELKAKRENFRKEELSMSKLNLMYRIEADEGQEKDH